MKTNIDYKLYLVTDRDLLKNTDLYTAVEEAIKGGVTLVQLREKDITTLDFYNTALNIKKVTDKYDIPLIINDRMDIALAVNASGVHIGQKDMPCTIARKILGNDKILGVSATTLSQAIKAEKEGADYIGVGAIFNTSTKQDAKPVSIDTLKEIKETLSIPVVAIGGITSKNIHLLDSSNIDGIAVISDILGKEDIRLASEDLNSLIKF
ncbi:thiamine phosphate synthase [Clostridium algidicarnis]|uniref:Thiamine-phosphate synthase n=1 Tax=Clostridium algidicarnis TaxID=37659 RepID=A0ABS6C6G0_9CLOT|nr:thiamine phosphate synthase [Clostridium algidicarnis]MBU3205079.1 thiamine phosphate synthase [Clostridium algidicarnis]MBU3213232.1 thiamine phosphate synthase [Clostridium algidicarnis]MBU3221016.1 thiamine phosphate synthase [Clostridium algidicarnis]MBU3223873.1 thiamine phosphate synthase [Clostridium algidicarnis]